MKQWQSIIRQIEQSTGKGFVASSMQTKNGGSINNAFILNSDDDQQYFIKTNRSGCQRMFEAEIKGLTAMASSNTLKVPKPLCFGDDGSQSYIVMECLEINGSANQADLGAQLASMHKSVVGQFGWEIDNTIGSTLQPNAWQANWLEFWRENRLGFQLSLAAKNGYGGELQTLGERLLSDMQVLFDDRIVVASMLHGDLWCGNVAGLSDGTPVVYDPAFYYGDRETDLAMTYVFGGFESDFYASYQNAYPLDDGFAVRKTFYNIYHILNHMNLFGGGYRGQAIHMMKQVLAELA